ncbi:MAG TPA: V-type ATP synthase subunit F [Myxococcota bacterium]|nr:V-type ATP synthase subunit F [Myxococcota bacterium]
MARIYYIGDEATAAGYRLAGAEVRVPTTDDAVEVFRRVRAAETDLVLLSAEFAAALPPEELEAAVQGERPLVAIVPDAHGRHAPPDVARDVRLALGIEP